MSKEIKDDRFDDELMALAESLPKGVAPERDLWPEIEKVIAMPVRERRSAWNSVWAQAAAVVLLVAGSSSVTYFAVKDEHGIPEVITAGEMFGELQPVSGNFGSRYTLGNDYLDARNQLESSMEKKLMTLTPESREVVITNLNTIRTAIHDLNEALAEEPDNVLLQELLLSTYHEEVALMRRVDGIANSAMRRDDI